ncbi:dihydropteroate synthase [Limibaculum sp. M0105]|uniref:Dihydropteroate synthase n=1 Tax=Thermohalobaculum xanthum TaxID=2753746 RepID=A0A8J7M861_9RHOB|nr:dihydropteroate synthase [Thermohalobaculum xanthum]MBK0400028.1 dihydropteroate synthase [Thermohalobaculum xanthum]
MSGASDRLYARPVPCFEARPGAWRLAGSRVFFREIEVLRRNASPEILPVDAAVAISPVLAEAVGRAGASRPDLAGVSLAKPAIMGVLNVTPDSFSDGGVHEGVAAAIGHGMAMAEAGAGIIDIGGESTRPGAQPVPEAQELDRVLPVIEGLRRAGCPAPISIDTRNAAVAHAALSAGATLFNDISALTHDPASLEVARAAPALCLMHALGDPQTMQRDPRYDDVLLDIYDWLEARVLAAEAAGIPRARIAVDPGIGFGKTLEHNLALLRRLSLFHGLGCAVLLGVSRKRFIGTLSGEGDAARRAPGSIAAGLAGLDQGAHLIRVHDVPETVQAVAVWNALREEGAGE